MAGDRSPRRATHALAASVVMLLRSGPPVAAQALGTEFQVNTYTTSQQLGAAVTLDAEGRFVVAWQSYGPDGSRYGIFARRYDALGQALAGEFRVNSVTTQDQVGPFVSALPSGGFVVVWASSNQDGSGTGVFGQRYDSTGAAVGPEFRANSYTTGNQGPASVSSDASGGFVVVWGSQGQDGSGVGVFARRYDSSGTELGPEFRVNAYTTGNQVFSSASSGASGSFVVVWASATQDGSLYGVFGQRYDSQGAPQGGEFRANTTTASAQSFPSVSMDVSGRFVVAWESYLQDGSGGGIFAQRYDASGAPQGGEFRVNTYTSNDQYRPAVASDASGSFVVAWESLGQDGGGYGIFAQRYDGAGATLGPEFRVNSYVTADQRQPRVGLAPDGRFVVVWRSLGQDGSLHGVFGRRFHVDVLFADGFQAG
jgi:hypothetical protein